MFEVFYYGVAVGSGSIVTGIKLANAMSLFTFVNLWTRGFVFN